MHTCACSTNSTRLLGNLPAMAAKLPKSDEASAHIYQSNGTYSNIQMFIYSALAFLAAFLRTLSSETHVAIVSWSVTRRQMVRPLL